jgi:hypothetical protein
MGIGDWGLGPIPNPQSPIPNPQSPIPNKLILSKLKITVKYRLNFNFKKLQKIYIY